MLTVVIEADPTVPGAPTPGKRFMRPHTAAPRDTLLPPVAVLAAHKKIIYNLNVNSVRHSKQHT